MTPKVRQHPGVIAHNEAAAIAADARAARIVEMRSTKLSWNAIAEEMHLSRQTVQSLYRRERARLRAITSLEMADQVDEELDGLDAVEATANEFMIDPKQTPERRMKAANLVLATKRQRADLLGLNAPDRLAVLHGGSVGSSSVDVPLEILEAMTDDELAAAIDGQRKLRAVDAQTEADEPRDEDDEREDDGLPPEVVIEDPGPRALAPAPSDPEPDERE